MKKETFQTFVKYFKYSFISLLTVGLIHVAVAESLILLPVALLFIAIINRDRILQELGYYREDKVVRIARYMVSDSRRTRYKLTSEENLEERLKEVNDPDLEWGEYYE